MNEIDRDVRGAIAAHATLESGLGSLTDADVRKPSTLPNWTIGHVLTHIARNAESHVLMLQAANNGEIAAQYPGGMEQRNADIEAGSTRSIAALVADVKTTNAALQEAWVTTTPRGWEGSGMMVNGLGAVADMPFRRWREAVVHHSDLGTYSWADWPNDYVRLDLQRMTALWASRKPMGLTTLPPEALAVDDRTRLAWLLGRTVIKGLAPADIY